MGYIKKYFHYGCRADNVFWNTLTRDGAGVENTQVTHEINNKTVITWIDNSDVMLTEVAIERNASIAWLKTSKNIDALFSVENVIG